MSLGLRSKKKERGRKQGQLLKVVAVEMVNYLNLFSSSDVSSIYSRISLSKYMSNRYADVLCSILGSDSSALAALEGFESEDALLQRALQMSMMDVASSPPPAETVSTTESSGGATVGATNMAATDADAAADDDDAALAAAMALSMENPRS